MGSHSVSKMTGVLGFYNDPETLLDAMNRVREANYRSFDAFTPYPVHGLEQAQGIKRSPLPYLTFLAGFTGFCVAFGFQYWTSAVDWPLIVGGKPLNSWPAFVPVMFELTVLFAGLATFGGLIALCRLPNTTKKSFDPSLTRDRFAILIEAPVDEEDVDSESSGKFKRFEESEASQFLSSTGAMDVKTVYPEGWF